MRVRNQLLCVKPPEIWRLVVISVTVTLISLQNANKTFFLEVWNICVMFKAPRRVLGM